MVEVEKVVEVEKQPKPILVKKPTIEPKAKAEGKIVRYRKLRNEGMSEAGWKMFNLVKQTQINKTEAEKKFEEIQAERERIREQKRLEREQKAKK